MKPERVGLVGVGLVGTALAELLQDAGIEVVGYDVDPARRRHLEGLGGEAVGSRAEVARATRCVVLSLPDTTVVRQVVEGPGGLLEAAPLPQSIIDTTTGDPEETTALAERLARHGVSFLDATLSGSSRQIRNREAVLMVGGERAAFDACRSLLETLSPKLFYLGPSGSGSRAKLATNLVLGLNRLALAEGLAFAEALGLDPGAFLELLQATPAASAIMATKGRKMLDGDFTPEGRLRQHHKDVTLILRYAEMLGQDLPLSQRHREVLEAAIAAGDGDLDNAAVLREIRRRRARRS